MRDWYRLRWENPDNACYYEARLAKDLWGHWYVQQLWGKMGTRRSQIQQRLVDNFSAGKTLLLAVAKQRRTKGYQLVTQIGQPDLLP